MSWINRRFALLAVAVVMAMACNNSSQPKIDYPPTTKGDVVDDYFGTRVADPYRWMEELESNSVADWVAAQNRVTSAFLETLPMREHFRKRITELWDYPKVSLPSREGDRYFYERNTGLQRQEALYVRRQSLTAEPSIVIDPNVLWPDGSISLAEWVPSRDGRLMAY